MASAPFHCPHCEPVMNVAPASAKVRGPVLQSARTAFGNSRRSVIGTPSL